MNKENCFYIGSIVRKYSFKGEVLVKVDSSLSDFIILLESLFIDINKDLVPFFICESRIHKTNIIHLKLEGIDDEKEANKLVGSDLYVLNSIVPESIKNKPISDYILIGYEVVDSSQGSLGKVFNIDDSTIQTLLIMEVDRVLIPFVDAFVEDINHEEKKIYVDLPEGLISMNNPSEI